ncbi:uncharacterized protein TNCV_408761 [Trichonephila clavipes]|nr:uncharacterized protein TNCV_408761 [Trichonephila clavipes]
MAEEKLLDHIISRLEPQFLDNVEVRHTQTTSSLLQLIDKYEESFLNRMTRGPSHDFRNTNHSANNQFTNRNRHENWRDTRVENQYNDTSRPQRDRFGDRFGGQDVGDNRRFDSRRRSGQSDHRFNNPGGRQGGSRNDVFRGNRQLPFSTFLISHLYWTLRHNTSLLPPSPSWAAILSHYPHFSTTNRNFFLLDTMLLKTISNSYISNRSFSFKINRTFSQNELIKAGIALKGQF